MNYPFIVKGASHDVATALLALAAYPVYRHNPDVGLALAGGILLGGLLFSPDLDLAYSKPSKRWGVLRLLWEPYRLFHPHRGDSHTYLYGPLSRLAYFTLLAVFFAHLFGLFGLPLPPLTLVGVTPLAFLLGYMLGNWLHLAMDGIPPPILAFRSRRRRKNS
jgi:uncharacterized metal-binding protein